MIWNILFLLVGFAALLKGADYLIESSSAVARRAGVSDFVVGLTIIAIGTSLPEFFISVVSAEQNAGNLLVGNVFGSNVTNILLILGVLAISRPLLMRSATVMKEIPFIVVLSGFVAVLATGAGPMRMIGMPGGIALLVTFLGFLYYIYRFSRTEAALTDVPARSIVNPVALAVTFVLGCIGLVFGSQIVVTSAVALSAMLGVSQASVGLTVVALGTSLPELATSFLASAKQRHEMAVGNIIGSNVFNISMALGTAAVIRPVVFSASLLNDLYVGLAAAVLLFIFAFTGERFTVKRWQGAILVLLYVIYIAVSVR
ncbi:calcium/sodium antiporter [Patescibacteria group bacterium]|nr:calcium/sodium antiporter [Patescibacteria group bacterium]